MGASSVQMLVAGIRSDFLPMVESALEDGVDINAVCLEGLTPLMLAVVMKRRSMVEFLTEKGANVNCVAQGFSPLMIAAQEGLSEIADTLIAAGADINAKTNDGLSVLMIAARDGHTKIVEKLLAKGVISDSTTDGGSTALDIARQNNQAKVIDLLEKHAGTHNYGVSSTLLDRMVVLNLDDAKASPSSDSAGKEGLRTSGYCPQCELEGKEVAMYLNQGDLFECPTCHLMISLATPAMATIIRRRGEGNIKSLDKYYCATNSMSNISLSREKDDTFESDGSIFGNIRELKEYLDTICVQEN